MVDGVLLDWEGVLVDTGAWRRDSLLRALADEGVHFDPAAYDESCRGHSVHGAAAAAVGLAVSDPTLIDLVALRAQRDFAAHIAQGFSLTPGAARLLALAQLRAPIAVVTAAGRDETDAVLRLADLHDSCAAVVTADDVPGEAPSREQYDKALAHLSRRRPVRADHLIALTATLPSIRAARAAGVRTVAFGVPAHIALEADASLASLEGISMDELATLAGISVERHA
ncbi:MAG: HAD family phosphatase [Gemmatimonadaceae bacterium]